MASFTKIRAVGFDLDGTLYPSNERIDDAIRDRIIVGLKQLFPNFGTISEIRIHYDLLYRRFGSATLVFQHLQVPEPTSFAYQCLAAAEVHQFLQMDQRLIALIQNIKDCFYTFLITNSPSDLALKKLKKLGIKIKMFDYTAFGEPSPLSRGEQRPYKPFKTFLNQSPYSPSQHLFLGDNLQADILLPNSLGMQTCSVGIAHPEADISISSIYEIQEYLPIAPS